MSARTPRLLHTAIDLAYKLTKAVDQNRLHRQIKALMQPKLLIIDEVGYLAFDPLQASLLFQVICQRYQRNQCIALTGNKAFSDWGQVFADDSVMASAALDRLLHRSTVINTKASLTASRKTQSRPLRLNDRKEAMTQQPTPQTGWVKSQFTKWVNLKWLLTRAPVALRHTQRCTRRSTGK